RHDHLHLAQHGRALFQQAQEQSPPGNTLRQNRRQFPRLHRHRLHQALASPFVNMTWPAYNEALKRRGSLTIWFDPEMSWDAAPTGRRGRQQTYSDAAIQTCLSMKVLFGMALRQTTGFVESLLRLVGLDWAVPDFSTLSRRQKTLAVNIPYRGSKGPLHLLIDST